MKFLRIPAVAIVTGLLLMPSEGRNQQNNNGNDWVTYGINPSETRYSPLTEINDGNASIPEPIDLEEESEGEEETERIDN